MSVSRKRETKIIKLSIKQPLPFETATQQPS